MKFREGFTYIEIIVVMSIIGILVLVAVPTYNGLVLNVQFQDIEHNLMYIASAQQKYYRDHGYYCGSSSASYPNIPSGCTGAWNTSTQSVNQSLGLNLPLPNAVPPGFNYYCTTGPANFYYCNANNGGGSGGLAADMLMQYSSTTGLTCIHQYNWNNNPPTYDYVTFPCP